MWRVLLYTEGSGYLLLQVCREIRNFFIYDSETGEYELKNGSIAVKKQYAVGGYAAISGSILNNGIKRVENFSNGVISFGINLAEYPVWVRPAGTVGLYSAGDKVTHNGERWISLIDNNSWEPGSVGTANLWQHIHDSLAEHTTVDEIFNGTIWSLRVPPDFIKLCEDIQTFQEQRETNGVVRERNANYDYTLATNKNGLPAEWEDIFSKRLDTFRKMFSDINI